LSIFHEIDDDGLKFEVLKSLAEMSTQYNGVSSLPANQPSCTTHELDILFNLVCEYLPKPPPIEETTTTPPAETTDGGGEKEEDKFNFSYVECLLYAFHVVGRFHSEYLQADENKERLREFRVRLQYFAKGTQNYIKELRNSLLSATAIANKDNDEVGRFYDE
jgi:hypothetical protein